MIKLREDILPEQDVMDKLKAWQNEIDRLGTFQEKIIKAKISFENKNRKGNPTFNKVKTKLIELCSGAERCVYCEDSKADEVEHICPKALYPEKCFEWENYVYACGTCNGPKNNQFAVFRDDNGALELLNVKVGEELIEPINGKPVLINPRFEDPMDYCILDISSTFKFVIIAQKGTDEYLKADYTFNKILRLNEQREYLRIARKTAFENYKSRLYVYTDKKLKGANFQVLEGLIENLQQECHPTVWKEMQRWHKRKILSKIDSELDNLFLASPEALDW